MGDVALGVDHRAPLFGRASVSAENKAFVDAFKKANNGMRPNFMAVGGYDGMHLIYEALKKTKGATDGEALLAAMKGMSLGEPARPDLDRSGDARHHPEHLHPQGREGRTASSTTSSSTTIPNVKDPVKAAKTVQCACPSPRRAPAGVRVQVGQRDPRLSARLHGVSKAWACRECS